MPNIVSGQAAAATTFLFTDIEGSTRLWEASAETMREALVRHDALANSIIDRHDGRVVKSRGEGDSLFAVFLNPVDGVLAACALQSAFHSERWPGGWSVRVRMALHRGSAEIRDEDFYGPTINRSARLRAIGHGGQILVSQTVYDSIQSALPDGFLVRDLGRHRLKDLQHPEQVYQISPPDVPTDFPPLLSLNYIQHNLPIQTTSFVGRDRELSQISAMLEESAAVTLVGTGGSGKSRLAIQAAADRVDNEVDGVWIVELASVGDADLVVQVVATVLGVREEPEQPLLQTLCAYLKPRTTLLVLDNCEHVLPACTALVETLLRACPNCKILSTSRERLGVSGERLYPVPALGLPPAPGDSSGSDQRALNPVTLLEFPSVRLFCERAQLQKPDFALSATNARDVVQICRKLDGIPLALELAAARVRSLPPSQILARLDDRFRILKGGSRTALPRQQTLEALIDWSYDLLSPPEKGLLQRLTIFSAGWTLEAVEEVCGQNTLAGPDESFDLLDLLTSLVDKSLIVFSGDTDEGRYGLLESIRHYASIKRGAGPALDELASRHAAYFLKLAKEAEPHLNGPEQADWMTRLEQDHDNLCAALMHCLPEKPGSNTDLSRRGLELCGALWWFWYVRGYLKEGRSWLKRALVSSSEAGDARAEALTGLSMLALQANDRLTAVTAQEEALVIRRAAGNVRGIAVSLTNLGSIALENGEFDRARGLYQECMALWQQLGETILLAQTWNNLGTVASMQGDIVEARNLFLQGLACLRAGGDSRNIALLLYNLAELELDEANYAAAEPFLEECLRILETVEDKFVHANAVHLLGRLAYETKREETALCLWGASQAAFASIGATLRPADDAVLETAKAALREQMGETQYSSIWLSGRNMQLGEAVAGLYASMSP